MPQAAHNQLKKVKHAMGTDLNKAGPVATVAEIAYSGEKLILPQGMAIKEAIDLLRRREQYLTTPVQLLETYDLFPWDGAYLLDRVLTRLFGWSAATVTPGFFRDTPPALVTIDTGPHSKISVPWGAFQLPGVEGRLSTGVSREGNRFKFQLAASVLRKDEATVTMVFEEVRKEAKLHSLYRGKAIKMRFRDDDGDPLEMPQPKFMDTDNIDPNGLIYSDSVMRAVQTNLFTPIERVSDCLRNGLPVKRGVLLGGVFGTGKTLAAMVAAKIAVEQGITYLYVPRADELPDAIEFAKQYQSPACVVFCEDIDRVMDGERDVEMDDILNIIDGIDTKHSNLIVVLTTNEMGKINPAMLRPGRLDAVIDVEPPDGPAVEKLLRHYGASSIRPDTNLQEVGAKLAGNIPAVIAEVVKRAKLAQLKLTERGSTITSISEAALLEAAQTMTKQLQLLKATKEVPPPSLDLALEDLVQRTVDSMARGLDKKLNALMDRFDVTV